MRFLHALWLRLIGQYPGRTLLRCTACDARLTVNPTGRAYWWCVAIWLVFAQLVVWDTGVSFGLGILWTFVFVIPYSLAEVRVRAALFRWKHPLRCNGDGHPAPEPEST